MATSSDSIACSGGPADQPARTFEQTLGRLEEIVHLLEDGKIGLDDALGSYEEGVGLLRQANGMLENAERKITLLTGLDAEGNPVLRPVEDAASFQAGNSTSATAKKSTSGRSRRNLANE